MAGAGDHEIATSDAGECCYWDRHVSGCSFEGLGLRAWIAQLLGRAA